MTRSLTFALCLLIPSIAYGLVANLGGKIRVFNEVEVLEGVINPAMRDEFDSRLLWSRASSDVILLINSPGGMVASGDRIYKALRAYVGNHKLICLVDDYAASMAFSILSQCDERYAVVGSRLLMHDVYMSLDKGPYRLEALKALVADLAPDVARFRRINGHALRLSRGEIKYLSDHGDVEFSVDQLISNGYLQGVGDVIED